MRRFIKQDEEWLELLVDEQPVEGMPYREVCDQGGVFEVDKYAPERIESTEHLLEIKIDGIANTLPDFSDSDNNYTLLENTNYVVRGTLDIPKNTFTVPFLRTDTSRKCYMIATIDDDKNFEIALNFKTGGEWIVNTELLNSELPEPMFRIAEHTFKVV